MERQVRAQLRSDSGRSSKVIKDREGIEAVVEVPLAGVLVLRMDSAGGTHCGGVPKVVKRRKPRGGICLRWAWCAPTGSWPSAPKRDLLRHRALLAEQSSSCPYSPKCLEEKFYELRPRRILGSSYPRACIKRCTQNVFGSFAPVRHLWASRLSVIHHDHHIISPKTSSYGGGATCL
jgi:hypothetical protein